jgi:hypothetical protein
MDLNNYILLAKDFILDKQFLNLLISTLVLFFASLLSWIVIFLIEPETISLGSIKSSLDIFYEQIPKVAKYLVFIIFVERVLRIGQWIITPRRETQ